MMKGIQLISFEKEQTKEILDLLEIRTKIIREVEIIFDENDKMAKCEVCNNKLNTSNLGNIAKGSKLLFCDNPACFATHLAKKDY